MLTLKKGDCEHCGMMYRYSLWHSVVGDNSYAYCDRCGALAILNYSHPLVMGFPPAGTIHEVIDESWEPFLRPCACGGRFRRDGAPRCPSCKKRLSPTHAAVHIEAQALGSGRGWHWQNSWSGLHCMAIEDPYNAGSLMQIEDPVGEVKAAKPKKRWWLPFRPAEEEPVSIREAAATEPE
jgi:hypothetical protein